MTANKVNKGIKPYINEFGSSKSDCFIWHRNSCRCVQILTTDEFDHHEDYEIYGNAIEIKSEDVDEGAITECFNNMFGCATKLLSIMLSQGKLVDEATVYSITCSMNKFNDSVILCLDLDFNTNKCNFYKLCNVLPFDFAVNVICCLGNKLKLTGKRYRVGY